MIEVSCAIFIDGSKIQAVQRGPKSSHPLKWEFPGGKIQLNETAVQCVVREIEEELSIRIVVLSQIEYVEFDYGTKQIRLIPFICKITSGELILTEHVSIRWFNLNEWQTINWSGADYQLVLKNQERINQELKFRSRFDDDNTFYLTK